MYEKYYLRLMKPNIGLGIFDPPTGTGKTYDLCKIVAKNKQPDTVFVIAEPTHKLLQEVQDQIKDNLSESGLDQEKINSSILYLKSKDRTLIDFYQWLVKDRTPNLVTVQDSLNQIFDEKVDKNLINAFLNLFKAGYDSNDKIYRPTFSKSHNNDPETNRKSKEQNDLYSNVTSAIENVFLKRKLQEYRSHHIRENNWEEDYLLSERQKYKKMIIDEMKNGNQEDWKFLWHLFPSTYLDQEMPFKKHPSIVLLTTQKLYYSDPNLFYHAPHMYEHFKNTDGRKYKIFMDEMDAAKGTFQQCIIEDAINKQVSYWDLIACFRANFKDESFVSFRYFFEGTGKDYEEEAHYQYDRLVKEVNRFFQEWWLTDNIKYKSNPIWKNTIGLKSGTLFSINENSNNATAQNICVCNPKVLTENIGTEEILHEQAKRFGKTLEEDDIKPLVIFCKECQKLTRSLLQYINTLANALRKRNHARIVTENMIKSAIHHISGNQGVQDFLEYNLYASYRRNQKIVANMRFDHSFYEKGFSLGTIMDSNSHESFSMVTLEAVPITPEKILYLIASQARVIGISATGRFDTPVLNFDLRYLEGKMGKDLEVLSAEDRRNIKNDLASRYQELEKVNLSVEEMQPEDLLKDYEKKDRRFKEIDKNVFRELEKRKEIGKEFEITRLEKYCLIYAIYLYNCIKHPKTCDSAMIIGNKFLKNVKNRNPEKMIFPDEADFNWESLEYYAKETASAFKRNYEDFPICQVQAGSSSSSQAAGRTSVDEIDNLYRQGKYPFVITVYNSAARGMNMQHIPGAKLDRDQLIYTDSLQMEKHGDLKKDYDILYLEKPTYVIPNNRDSFPDYIGYQKNIFNQLCFLYEMDESAVITDKERFNKINTILKGNGWNPYDDDIKKSEPCMMASAVKITQALGRVPRSGVKTIRTQYFLDSGVIDVLSKLDPEQYIFNRDMECIIEKANAIWSASADKEEIISFWKRKKKRNLQSIAKKNNDFKKSFNAIITAVNLYHGQAPDSTAIDRFENDRFIYEWYRRIARHTSLTKEEYEKLTAEVEQIAKERPFPKSLFQQMYFHIPINTRQFWTVHFQGDKGNGWADGICFEKEEENLWKRKKDRKPCFHIYDDNTLRMQDNFGVPGLKEYLVSLGYTEELIKEDAEYVLVPSAINDLTKGILGEDRDKYILKTWGYSAEDITEAEIYELFDYTIGYENPRIFVDSKNWISYEISERTQKKELEEAIHKAKIADTKKVIYIDGIVDTRMNVNQRYHPANACMEYSDDDNDIRVLTLYGLYYIDKDGVTRENTHAKDMLRNFIEGEES